MRLAISTLLALILILPLTGQDASGQTQSAFSDGTAASRAGDYAAAATHFERARAAGDRRPVLAFNLAVTYYHLGRYPDADRLFRELLLEPRWMDLARFNLGLVAVAREDRNGARHWFTLVEREAADAGLRALAVERLAALESRTPPPRTDARRPIGLVGAYAGLDSNVVAFPDALQADTSLGEDSFVELLGFAQGYVGDARLHAFAYTRRHSELDLFDPTSYGAGATLEHALGDWLAETGVYVGHNSVGGDALTTDVGLRLGLRRDFGVGRIALVYRPALHSAGSLYPELDGSSHRLEASWQRFGAQSFNVAYRYEYNDRADLETTDGFFSHSPVRHRLLAETTVPVPGALTFRVGASHETSAYRATNRMADVDDVVREAVRRSNRTDAWLRGQFDFTRSWSLTGEARYTRHADTFSFYEYDRGTVSVGMEYAFR